MSTEKRLTATELVDELRSSLAVTTRWIPALSGSHGPSEDAPLLDVARCLAEFAGAPGIDPSVAQELRRAAESATAAASADAARAYGHLGTAYAYVLQAHRLASASKTV